MFLRDRDIAEKKLWAAVLEQAIRDYAGTRYKMVSGQTVAQKRDMRAAKVWIFYSDRTDETSFNTVCSILGMDPEYARKLIKEITSGGLNKKNV